MENQLMKRMCRADESVFVYKWSMSWNRKLLLETNGQFSRDRRLGKVLFYCYALNT